MMKQISLATGSDRFETDSWQQANIHAARLGDAEVARDLNARKMENGPYRFPAFWPETIDWAPDHNWGGSGMIGIQEMLLQTHFASGELGKIRLLPAWPAEWDVDFKLHAPGRTTVECRFESGEIVCLKVEPKERQSDFAHCSPESFYAAAKDLAGSVKDGPPDLSTAPKYLEGFGR